PVLRRCVLFVPRLDVSHLREARLVAPVRHHVERLVRGILAHGNLRVFLVALVAVRTELEGFLPGEGCPFLPAVREDQPDRWEVADVRSQAKMPPRRDLDRDGHWGTRRV